MRIDIVTIFPATVTAMLQEGMVRRAIDAGLVDVQVQDLREYTDDRHRSVDDVPYGGGPGMVLKSEPLFRAIDAIEADSGRPDAVVLTSPQGKRFAHGDADRLSRLSHLTVLCGRYEGVDERVREGIVTEELSIGDYVLTGGELPALVIVDAVARLVPGVVGDAESVEHESFVRGLLDFPQYTRPAEVRKLKVPATLLSGHHQDIARWRKREAVRRTLDRRPDLLAQASLDDEERAILQELLTEREKEAGA
ncbi:MAG: tRNA (guanosine(37)-N1)-methyltransferase TrmD [Vicinamibacterales bacterium]|jgi:tRNA (guanine37-N1)-methyltransferase|nr:tRNA (guanosine(37)-N1)-methyltransferase TrmD [Acidobacteriota bacterium]MDP6373956.1 tRNA (guanosine(37)-N1)-methyltransferase TrmD [Vicinamibacterales bacterium]MDP6609465.1 tRNA (guanosine(37)-N1)-methyltransferase TrmD [Vicinamibacterales bacterium]HAK56646.1 tRNA (guanosine(37)-N1)-methyltransferase TrmD [Acidobacteriota bacterium]|tara:strand:- start:1997 stop:2749 length:753 start_codon:yes stop_codon:yes gene_type:complete